MTTKLSYSNQHTHIKTNSTLIAKPQLTAALISITTSVIIKQNPIPTNSHTTATSIPLIHMPMQHQYQHQ
jgi:hypothetical protein